MVAHFTMRTHGVNQAFWFVEGIWLHRESHQIRFFFRKKTLFTSYVRNVNWATISYKNHDIGRQNHISFAKAIPHKMIRYMIHMIFFLSK